MSLSDCEKCWDTPCTCGHQYRNYTDEKRTELAAAALGIPVADLRAALAAKTEGVAVCTHPFRVGTAEEVAKGNSTCSICGTELKDAPAKTVEPVAAAWGVFDGDTEQPYKVFYGYPWAIDDAEALAEIPHQILTGRKVKLSVHALGRIVPAATVVIEPVVRAWEYVQTMPGGGTHLFATNERMEQDDISELSFSEFPLGRIAQAATVAPVGEVVGNGETAGMYDIYPAGTLVYLAAPAVQQGGEACDRDAVHDATLELVARTIRDWAYPSDEMFVSSAMDAIASLKSPAAAHPVMDGKCGEVTPEQIEEYIHMADLELGHECCEAWVESCRRILRTAIKGYKP